MNGSVPAEKEASVMRELEEIGKAHDKIRERANELEAKLSVVMSDSYPVPSDMTMNEVAETAVSEMLSRARLLVEDANQLSRMIGGITQRLQI